MTLTAYPPPAIVTLAIDARGRLSPVAVLCYCLVAVARAGMRMAADARPSRASQGVSESIGEIVADNILRLHSGRPLLHTVGGPDSSA